MVQGLSGSKFCLARAEYENGDTIRFGNGTLTFNDDKTFSIETDSTYKAITGKWDLCCKWSDFGNYVFKVDGLPEWKQADPNLFVLVDKKKVRLFFSVCPDHLTEVRSNREIYNRIAYLATTPLDLSNSTDEEIKNHLTSREGDSLRSLLNADLIEFHDDSINKFKVDNIVLFKKSNYYVLYDVANRQNKFERIIDTAYRQKITKVDKNLYLVEE